MQNIRVFERDTIEYQKLCVACQLMSLYNSKLTFNVNTIYFDFGQDWKWTTIVVFLSNGNSYQITPNQQKNILLADNIYQLAVACDEIVTKAKNFDV